MNKDQGFQVHLDMEYDNNSKIRMEEDLAFKSLVVEEHDNNRTEILPYL